MIVVDANLLLYAQDSSSAFHNKAKKWWDNQLSGTERIGLSWIVLNAFIRISSNHRVYEQPLSIQEASKIIDSWLSQPCVEIIHPTENHWQIFRELMLEYQVKGNLVTDAHIAAMTLAYGGKLYSSDYDFSRFKKLKWINPLS